MGRTIPLDDDVTERLEAAAAQAQKSPVEVANEMMRRELPPPTPFRIDGPFVRSKPGIRMQNVEDVLDEAEGPMRK